jgi:hypothetical protein
MPKALPGNLLERRRKIMGKHLSREWYSAETRNAERLGQLAPFCSIDPLLFIFYTTVKIRLGEHFHKFHRSF